MNRSIFKTVYRHGKLYDTATNKRIVLQEGSVVELIVQEKDILNLDAYNLELAPTKSEDVHQALVIKKEKGKVFSFKKIADQGNCLSFTIKAGKRNTKTGTYAIESKFVVRLLSDLYMIRKDEKDIYGKVSDCSCVVESALNLDNFEPFYAYSLNDAYTKTYEFYFSLYGKSTTNVYNSFWLHDGKDKTLLSQFRVYP
jgi:hypothetical protein